MFHEGLGDKGKGMFVVAKFFPSGPVDVAFEI